MPTFPPHFEFAVTFLQSNRDHNLEAHLTHIRYIVGAGEEGALTAMIGARGLSEPSLVFVQGFQPLIDKYNPTGSYLSEGELLLAGKVKFQSIKKLLGLLESTTDLTMLIDSESYFVRPIHFAQAVHAGNTVMYTWRTSNPTQREAMGVSASVLGLSGETPWIGLVGAVYQWIFPTAMVRDVYARFGSAIFGHAGFLFLSHLLFLHMWESGYTGFNFVNLDDVLPSWYYPEHTYVQYNLDTWETRRVLDYIYRQGRGFFCFSVQEDDDVDYRYDRSERVIREYAEIALITSTPWRFSV